MILFKKRAGIKKFNLLTYILLTIWAMTTLVPLFWVLMNSFKQDISFSLPESLDFTNYKTISGYLNVYRALFNSLFVSGITVFVTALFGGMAAFALSRFKFKYSELLRMFFFGSLLVPTFAIVVPVFIMEKDYLPMVQNTLWALIIPQIGLNLPFTVIILSSFMVSLPVELEEAAILEGCGVLGIFRRIIIPMSVPAFATTSIMVFLWSYNDLFLSLILLPRQELRPICSLLSYAQSLYDTNYGAMMAAIIVTILPVMILYMVSQEYVIKGLTAGAVKG